MNVKGTIRNMGRVHSEMMGRTQSSTVRVQRQRKDGTWGKSQDTRRFGQETDEQVVERLNKNNPNTMFRLSK